MLNAACRAWLFRLGLAAAKVTPPMGSTPPSAVGLPRMQSPLEDRSAALRASREVQKGRCLILVVTNRGITTHNWARLHNPLFPTHHLLLPAHYSRVTTHYSLLTTHFSLFTIHHSLLTSHYSLLTTHYSLLTTHH